MVGRGKTFASIDDKWQDLIMPACPSPARLFACLTAALRPALRTGLLQQSNNRRLHFSESDGKPGIHNPDHGSGLFEMQACATSKFDFNLMKVAERTANGSLRNWRSELSELLAHLHTQRIYKVGASGWENFRPGTVSTFPRPSVAVTPVRPVARRVYLCCPLDSAVHVVSGSSARSAVLGASLG